ncbi:hypothetical protein EDEG_00199 [Edhazardia aedis USNM 41457]|uniref:t-SNARE coiled-coil homology domain-containing protein n=1 Tax=Edhazardia aedis (strain USNM 41457) TaxID=1003232 RepID=J9DQA1_EDHAE|nr:hypothetical protein EDEG_00199 [Edhazardia aedis USNM 41457]|eukprot:EJW03517.1 hypothetical protein EDEG_00199 [Edhazardia aedis USNM 41457]
MNRTDEYLSFLKNMELQKTFEFPKQNKFYHTLFKKILKINGLLENKPSYLDVLVIEEKYNKLLKEIQDVFDVIDFKSDKDEIMHFNGIKSILNLRLNITDNKIKNMKNESIRIKVELEPELANDEADSRFNNNNFTDSTIQMMEKENEKLVNRFTDYNLQKAQRKLMEIQSIQDLIGIHIDAQDERIDNITFDIQESKKNIVSASKYMKDAGGSVFRRFLFLFLLCLSFVLLFLNFYNR